MRKIMFRGKCDDKWHFGDLLHAFYDNELVIEERDIRGCIIRNRIVPATVGQFTGLKDCEGREIYEGDVVRHENCICLVVYNSTRFASFALRKDGWAFDHYFGEAFDASECQVIGNVHDNTGLLEATHD